MNHRHLVAAGATVLVNGEKVDLPDRPTAGYPDAYPFEIEINSLRSYKGENLEEFKGQTISAPVIIN